MKRILNHKTEYYECENCGSQVGLVNDICHNCNSPLTETVHNTERVEDNFKNIFYMSSFLIVLLIFLRFYDTSSVDICKCLENASYYNSNEKDCDKSINSKLGHNWKTTNYSQEPVKSAKFDALQNKCK